MIASDPMAARSLTPMWMLCHGCLLGSMMIGRLPIGDSCGRARSQTPRCTAPLAARDFVEMAPREQRARRQRNSTPGISYPTDYAELLAFLLPQCFQTPVANISAKIADR